ncbi:MAG TPA: hypothetical protein VIB39_15850 [Candidatus Angelobacter sp.]
MPGLKIPQEQLPTLERIRTISSNSLQAFISALQKSPEDVPAIPELTQDEAERLKNAVTELYSVRSYFDVDVPAFVADVADALQEQLHVNRLDDFKDRLAALLTIDSINLSVKAMSLKAEYERTFCSARILTDIRPIYSNDISGPPPAAMIVHTLRISYHDDSSRVNEIYVALDNDDVSALREILDRAELKAKSLEKFLAGTKVRLIASGESR